MALSGSDRAAGLLSAARFSCAEFGTAEACRQAFLRATPLNQDRFKVLLRAGDDAEIPI